MKRLSIIATVSLLLIPVTRCAPSEPKDQDEPRRDETGGKKELSQKQDPQTPQITFPFPFFPFRPDSSLTPAMNPYNFPFLFPSFVSRPSNLQRSVDLPLLPVETFVISDGEQGLRKGPASDKKKQKKKKKKQKKPKTPKPLVVYQKENQVALEGPNLQPGFAGQFANGNQGSYMGYYMVYLVEVRWNGSNQTQTIIAGRPVLTTNPVPTESAQITDLSGSVITESPLKPPATTQCLFQRSTTVDLSGISRPPGPTENPDQEIISEELETAEDYDEDDPKKNKKKKNQKTSKTEAPISHPT